jgi:hypothetical protein
MCETKNHTQGLPHTSNYPDRMNRGHHCDAKIAVFENRNVTSDTIFATQLAFQTLVGLDVGFVNIYRVKRFKQSKTYNAKMS